MSTHVVTLEDTFIARGDRTVLIEGNRYFPPDAIRENHVTFRDAISVTDQ